MSDASEEMVKQLGLYADTITALATVQLLGFIYLIAQGGCFSEGVLTAISLPVGIGFGVSAGLHRTSVFVSSQRIVYSLQNQETIEKVIQNIVEAFGPHVNDRSPRLGRYHRCPLLVQHGASIGRFCFDCKEWSLS